MIGDSEPRRVQVETSAETPNCPQCSRPGLISALVPHVTVNGRGEEVRGSMVAVLCSACDVDSTGAGALITFFTVHGTVTDETIDEVAPLLEEWAQNAKPKPFDAAKLHDEYEQWAAGEL